MILTIARELILFPFQLFYEFWGVILFSPKVREKKAPDPQELIRRVKVLEASNNSLADLNNSLQYQLHEMERRFPRELEEQEKRWRKIVDDLKRQLSWERLKK